VAPTPMHQQETIMMEWSEEEARPQRRRRSLARKRRPPRTWCPDGPMGTKGALRMSVIGGSSDPRPPAPILNFRCLSFVLYMCN
jgi:hypothetical protein